MKTVPLFLRGGFRAAVRLSLQEVVSGLDRWCCPAGTTVEVLSPTHVVESPMPRWVGPKEEIGNEPPEVLAGEWLALIADSESVSRTREREGVSIPMGGQRSWPCWESYLRSPGSGIHGGSAMGQEHVERLDGHADGQRPRSRLRPELDHDAGQAITQSAAI